VHSNKGKLRIIAGEFRGRRIAVPSRPGLRPTPDRVRETLFNWLGQWLPGLACLDLFAGSGALGFEAASRGAKRVVMVENDRPTVELLEKTCRELAAGQVEIVAGDALAFLQKTDEKFDIVFLDPPFRQNALPTVLKRLPARLTAAARVYVESVVPLKVEDEWEELRASRAGQVSYQLLEWRGDDQGRVSGNV
jgi:16S rRNA (guanine966-N2)-methyltransferase